MYEIHLAQEVKDDLMQIPAHYRSIILDVIKKHLAHEPLRETKRKKILVSLVPDFEAVPPVWQLKVGSYRVFYDVDEAEKIVFVRLVRKKPAHKTTEEIL
jgi:mRNA-degrading endonuclease RelE of RelBE toxin-antitoxin system